MTLDTYGKVYKNYDLYKHNTYKLHSICNYFIIVSDIIKLTNLINYLTKENIKYFIIGNGSNIILPEKYDGIVIKLDINELIIENNKVIVSASYKLNKLVKKTIEYNLSGLEWAFGIPGTIGGSIIGNAGAYNDEIMNYVESLEVLENNKVKILKRNDFTYSYRNTSLKTKNIIILKATLKLSKGNKEFSLNLIKDRQERRIKTQPLKYPSAGSVFRNPENTYAGKLIEDLNLKGKTIGGAKVSEKHANFIINYNNATSKDIIKLINYVHNEVLKNYNIDLILEQIIIN